MSFASSPIVIVLLTTFVCFIGVMAFSSGYQLGADLARKHHQESSEGEEK